jgi:hypothetical protein
MSEAFLVLMNISMDIENVQVPKVLNFFYIWENYKLLNLVIFEKWEYMYIFCMRYIVSWCGTFSFDLSHTLNRRENAWQNSSVQ